MNLRIPGPTPVPDDILNAGARQMLDPRGPEFQSILSNVTAVSYTHLTLPTTPYV